MTTSTFNKIVRSNFNLKPWILSKNTSQIVNTCIEKIYKQIPNNFKKDLIQTKVASPKTENKAPIQVFRSQECRTMPTIQAQSNASKLRPNNTNGERLLNAIMTNASNTIKRVIGGGTNFAANKKLLKTANYKIYGSRRFGSTASSSNASIFRRFDERRRNRLQQQGQFSARRSLGLQYGSKSNFGYNAGLTRIMPVRNQHMQSHLGSVPQAIEVSNSIQRDLMIIDNLLKDRISLAKSKLTKLSPEVNASDAKKEGSLRGWDHPPAPDVFFSRFHERGIAGAELQEQHRKLRVVYKKKVGSRYSLERPDFGFSCKQGLRLNDAFKSVLKDPPRHQQPLRVPRPNPMPSGRFSVPKPMETMDDAAALAAPVVNRATAPEDTATSIMAAAATMNMPFNSRFNHSMFYKSNRY